jgi:hypothetical protein
MTNCFTDVEAIKSFTLITRMAIVSQRPSNHLTMIQLPHSHSLTIFWSVDHETKSSGLGTLLNQLNLTFNLNLRITTT